MVSIIKASNLDFATCLFNGIGCCDKKLHNVTLKCITLDLIFIVQKFGEELWPNIIKPFDRYGNSFSHFPVMIGISRYGMAIIGLTPYKT